MKISRDELVKIISAKKGACFIAAKTVTAPQLKKSCPHKVVSEARISGIIGAIYENSVNNQREREEKPTDFEARPLPWGRHFNQYFIEHKGNFYLKYKPEKDLERVYTDENGNELDFSKDIAPYMYNRTSRQELDKEVKWRTIGVNSIVEISLDKNVYVLDGVSSQKE